MRVLIVAKTRRGTGACVGGITQHGQSVRLIAADAAHNEHAGLEYNVGEVWEMESTPEPDLIPPHVENIIIHSAQRLKLAENIEAIIRRFMPPVAGGPENLFDGRLQHLPSGALFIAERTGLPGRSTMFWTPDQPLRMDVEAKRIRYRYPTPDGGRLLTFVGFQEPVEVIPAGTMLRVSLAHWWHPSDKHDDELHCHAQLSGWFLSRVATDVSPLHLPAGTGKNLERTHVRCHDHEKSAKPDFARARHVLKQTFGFADFYPLQADIVRRILQREDTLVIMPTGGGKSLCYQLPALLHDGLTVVVSPLIALMQDQVTQLRELGVGAAFLNSTLSHHEYVAITHRIREGAIRILYVAPETMLRPETLVLLEHSRVSCIAVDEAHCISEWGHDFRPEYRQIQNVRQRFPQTVCVALTATATPRVREDIRRLLGIADDGEFVASFNRPNLLLGIQPRRDALGQTLAFLEQHRGQAGIIYCSSRKGVDGLCNELRARGWIALAYHAGMEADSRRRNQDDFLHADATIMVATVAFGMGINKSNVRFVLHFNLPKDIESYYQEIGRAGRDGLPADCLLLHSRADAITIRKFIDEGAPSERAGRSARLDALIRYAETTGCRRSPLLSYFGEQHDSACGHCDNCRNSARPADLADLADVTEAARKLFSCVSHTGEVFGAAHIIDVLRGSKSKRVLDRKHDRLSSYGIGKETSKDDWQQLVQQFNGQGLLEQDVQFGGLRLTAKAHLVLKGEKVFVRRESVKPPPALAESAPTEHDPELFELLRTLRRELAHQAGMPSYIIFSDRALVEMATQLPRTPEQFLAINGVGETKLANYGEQFLKIIRDYCAAQTARQPVSATTQAEPARWLTAHHRHEEIGAAFAAGQSLDELAAQFGIKPATVLQNLTRYAEAGGTVNGERLLRSSRLPEPERERVLRAFKQFGLDRLGPVHEALDGTVSYEELHLLRLWLKCRPAPG